jgi:hypothetical protein
MEEVLSVSRQILTQVLQKPTYRMKPTLGQANEAAHKKCSWAEVGVGW